MNTNRHGRRQLHQARSRLANEMCPGDSSTPTLSEWLLPTLDALCATPLPPAGR
ncbi:hypothetical protein K466DRAFT_592362 [Polyporus arcularius HHB13444]|uniref:Uncharacterized protein n=1 Tax=Polyporus arcularius HHB13444 TaxID=1314778 RepID=A0A5C3NS10_9APHY|nr:hypothetical protein K466DRAFT_592362 [Polyporus arcularius HHB13444]